MRTLFALTIALLLGSASAWAQTDNKKKTDKPRAGSGVGKQDGSGGQSGSTANPPTNKKTDRSSTDTGGEDNEQLLGDENSKAKKAVDGDARSRSGKASGNPNNRSSGSEMNQGTGTSQPSSSSSGSSTTTSDGTRQNSPGGTGNASPASADTTTQGVPNTGPMTGQEGGGSAGGSSGSSPETESGSTTGTETREGENEEASNVSAIPSSDSSPAGSPASLSGNNGAEPDGTNNKQRASYNMAGSPVQNMKLDKQDVSTNEEIKRTQREDRQNTPPVNSHMLEQQKKDPKNTTDPAGSLNKDLTDDGNGGREASLNTQEDPSAAQSATQENTKEKPTKKESRKSKRKSRKSDKDNS